MKNFIAAIVAQLKNLVTEPDNKTLCPVRVIALVGTIQGLGLQFYAVVYQHAAFDIQQFGVGLGAVLTTAGVALGLKKDTPPTAPGAGDGARARDGAGESK